MNAKLKLHFVVCAEGTLQVRDRGGRLRPTPFAVGEGRHGGAGDVGAAGRHQRVLKRQTDFESDFVVNLLTLVKPWI